MNIERNEFIRMEHSPIHVSMKFAISFCTALILYQSGCKNNPVDAPIKNPREYMWTIDTLRLDPISYPGAAKQILLQSIWGSATDLYAVGHSSGSAGTMWHFDGKKWSNVRLGTFEGGPIPGPFDLSCIHGSGPDNIYAVGRRLGPTAYGRSFVIHFDGRQWKEAQMPVGFGLLAVWANAVNDVWACGIDKSFFHFNGAQWQNDSLVVAPPEGTQLFSLLSIARIQGEMFMLAAAYNLIPTFSRWTYYFFRRPENMWEQVDTFEITSAGSNIKWGGASLSILTSGSAYSVDMYGVFQWKGERWIPRYQTAKSTQGVFGTADDNLFVTGGRGMLVHWNGADWFEYTHLAQSDAIYAGGWADKQQVFVLGWVDGWETVVLHGRNMPILSGR